MTFLAVSSYCNFSAFIFFRDCQNLLYLSNFTIMNKVLAMLIARLDKVLSKLFQFILLNIFHRCFCYVKHLKDTF